MKVKAINYAVFTSNEDFVKWQEDNDVAVHGVMPMINNVVARNGNDDITATASWTVGCFITYTKGKI